MGQAHPRFNRPTARSTPDGKMEPPAKTGSKWLRRHRTGIALGDWYKDEVQMKRADWGAAFLNGQTAKERAAKEKREELAMRGKFRTRKHDGKQKGKKKKK